MLMNIWPQVLVDLDNLYANQYLYGQSWSANFMDILTPPSTWMDKKGNVYQSKDVIFGVKSLNIFIAQSPYGWTVDPSSPTGQYTFSWNDPNSVYSQSISASIASWRLIYPRFASYKTLIWVDMFTANQVQLQNPCTDLPAMMMQTATQIQNLCNMVPGFRYMGTITEAKPASFFQPYIDNFYGNPKYPLYRAFDTNPGI